MPVENKITPLDLLKDVPNIEKEFTYFQPKPV